MEEEIRKITEEDLRKLPMQFSVAFAARAALRVIPLLADSIYFKDSNQAVDKIKVVENAIHSAIFYSLKKITGNNVYDDVASASAAYRAYTYASNFNASFSAAYAAASANIDNVYAAALVVANMDNTTFDYFASIYSDRANIEDAVNDYQYLVKYSSNKEVPKSFYKSPLWKDRTDGWSGIEARFFEFLKKIDYSKLIERYQSGGAAYIDLSIEATRPDEKFLDKLLKRNKIDDLWEDKAEQELGEEEKENEVDNTEESKEQIVEEQIPIDPTNKAAFSIQSENLPPAMGIEPQVKTFTGLIANFGRIEKGQFVGIFGKWGRGKTFFWNEVEKELKNTNQFVTVTFHAWKYQTTPASWAYLYETLAKEYFNKPEVFYFWRWHKDHIPYFWNRLKLSINRGAWKVPFLSLLLGAIISVFIYFFHGNYFTKSLISIPSLPLLAFIYNYLSKNYSTQAKDMFEKFSKSVSFEKHLGTQAEIQKELITLLKSWFPNPEKKRLVLFVDDIDRCEESKIIQIVDALRIMLEESEIISRMIIIAAIDERILKRAIWNKYSTLIPKDSDILKIHEKEIQTVIKKDNEKEIRNILEQENPTKKCRIDTLNELVREYMDKLFITGIKLQELKTSEMGNYFSVLLSRTNLNDKDILPEKFKVKKMKNEKTDEPVITSEEKTDPESGINFAEIKIAASRIEDSDQTQGTCEIISEIKEGKAPKEIHQMEQYEKRVLGELINLIPDATPRQIRIWYYRYMLAIRLLIPLFEKNSEELDVFVKNLKDYSKLLATLILHYGLVYEIRNLQTDFYEYSKTNSKTVKLSLLDNKYEFSADKKILTKIFEVIEMVVAY